MPPSTLVAEATRRSGVLWLSSPSLGPTLLWHVWHDGAAHVVCGGDEQSLPDPGPTATVLVRGTSGARVVEWAAVVTVVAPGTPPWDEVVPLLAAERLNAPSVEELPARWAAASTVLRLSPADQDGSAGDPAQDTCGEDTRRQDTRAQDTCG